MSFPQHLPSHPPHPRKTPASLLNLHGGLGFALSPGEALQPGGGQQSATVHLVILVGRKENGYTSCLTQRGPRVWGMILGYTSEVAPSSVLTCLLRQSMFSTWANLNFVSCKKCLLFPVTLRSFFLKVKKIPLNKRGSCR